MYSKQIQIAGVRSDSEGLLAQAVKVQEHAPLCDDCLRRRGLSEKSGIDDQFICHSSSSGSSLLRSPIHDYVDLCATSFGGGEHGGRAVRSEEHTCELQSRVDLVCRL